ncbi:UDP-glycosyltransferase 73E1-like protein [Tanacetum coccineum]
MAFRPEDLHFVLFPSMAQGHLIPMVDMGRILAQRGAVVTIITSPVNANRFKSVIDRAVEAKLKIQVLELELPLVEVGLPEGHENFDLLSSVDQALKMFSAMKLLEKPAENVLSVLCPPPSCIISDGGFPWTSDVAKRLNIPRLVFYGPGCFTFLCIHIVTNTNILDKIDSNSEYFVMPGLPDQIELTKPQASTWGKGDSKETTEMFDRLLEAEKTSSGIVVNSFMELEPNFEDLSERGNQPAINKLDCLKWLDSREQGSVVYVCLGSLWYGSAEQAIELGLGLESSNKPFIWFIRQTSDEFERWLLEEGYEERIKDRGLLVRGWAPQILILSHEAIGSFVTHCGWNSTLEGICAGIPMVTWPHFADQFLNERFIVDVLKIGVKIGAEFPAMYVVQDNSELLVKKEDVKTAVERLMNNDEEGEERRKRVKEFKIMAKRSMEEGGSSHHNMTMMIKTILQEVNIKTEPI